MKKFLFTTWLLLAAFLCFAFTDQSTSTLPPSKKNKAERFAVIKDSIHRIDSSIILVDVPRSLNIKDKITVVNKSPHYILLSTVAYLDVDGLYRKIGTFTDLAPQQEWELASYEDNRLKELKGKVLAVKVKALKNRKVKDGRPNDTDGTPADDELTYDFRLKLHEFRHDLYIEFYDVPRDAKTLMSF